MKQLYLINLVVVLLWLRRSRGTVVSFFRSLFFSVFVVCFVVFLVIVHFFLVAFSFSNMLLPSHKKIKRGHPGLLEGYLHSKEYGFELDAYAFLLEV